MSISLDCAFHYTFNYTFPLHCPLRSIVPSFTRCSTAPLAAPDPEATFTPQREQTGFSAFSRHPPTIFSSSTRVFTDRLTDTLLLSFSPSVCVFPPLESACTPNIRPTCHFHLASQQTKKQRRYYSGAVESSRVEWIESGVLL
ncbi:hypothetical protein GQ42DRAFT_23004 [Ramicandelaber brevisporus]|nr:hypothetical protein GQ42DRAFT_23004 [Ramicandelaber brevisporus]